jgi:colicin import membrane protein
VAARVRERPPEVARAGRVDPRLWNALGWSVAGHVLVVVVALVLAVYAPAPTMFELPPGGPVVDLVSPRGDSKIFKVGPLAKASGQKATAAKDTVKPEPPQSEPPKTEPPKVEPPKPEPPKVEPKPEPAKPEPPKVEPKPEALPEPKKLEPKPEPKKPEPKPEPKKPEPKKPEPKKPEPKPEPPKPEPKTEPKTPQAQVEPAKPSEPASAPKDAPKDGLPQAEPLPGQADAGSSKPGVAAQGGGQTPGAGQSGDPNGGGGGAGNRSPEFYAYFAYMYESVKAQWVWAGQQDATLAATVRFSILADGSIADARVTERSRSALYDESALNAVRATGGLTPPPPNVRADFEDVELVFRAGDLMQP